MKSWITVIWLIGAAALVGSMAFGCNLARDGLYTGFKGLYFGMTAEAVLETLPVTPSSESEHELVYDNLTDELESVHHNFGLDRPFRLTLGLHAERTEPSLQRIETHYSYAPGESQLAQADYAAIVAKLQPFLTTQRYSRDEPDADTYVWTKGNSTVSVQLETLADSHSHIRITIER